MRTSEVIYEHDNEDESEDSDDSSVSSNDSNIDWARNEGPLPEPPLFTQ